MIHKVLINMRIGGKKMSIGNLIEQRMNALGISRDELIENSFVDENIIDDLLNNNKTVDNVDMLDMEFISEALYCKTEYFLDEKVREKDVLSNSLNRGKESIKSNNIKVRIQSIMENFDMLNAIYEESGV